MGTLVAAISSILSCGCSVAGIIITIGGSGEAGH